MTRLSISSMRATTLVVMPAASMAVIPATTGVGTGAGAEVKGEVDNTGAAPPPEVSSTLASRLA